jgi:hypothetical protein
MAAAVTAGKTSGCFAGGVFNGGADKDADGCKVAGAAGSARAMSAGTTGSAVFTGGASAVAAPSRLSLADADWGCASSAGARIRVLKLMEYWLQDLMGTGFSAPTAKPLTNSTVAMPAVNFLLSLNFSKLSRFHWPLRMPLLAVPEM